ncbi:UNVERIFIED_ORG: hypothetical protein M2312_005380, partial [Rhizobium esperanzae]|nr:hypothetical protein [Rhizobium esperanzae]
MSGSVRRGRSAGELVTGRRTPDGNEECGFSLSLSLSLSAKHNFSSVIPVLVTGIQQPRVHAAEDLQRCRRNGHILAKRRRVCFPFKSPFGLQTQAGWIPVTSTGMTEEMLCFAMEQAAVRPFDSAQGTALALRVAQGVVAAIDSLDRLLGLRPIGANLSVDVRLRAAFAAALAVDGATGRWRS